MNAAYPPHSRLAGGGSRAGPGPARAPVLAVLYARELGRRGAHRPLRLGAPAGALAPLLTVDEHLRLFGAVGGTGRARSVSTGHRLLSRLGWYPEGARAAGALSGGTQQKLNVALAQLDSPDLLLLDEPYQGFDALAHEDLWTLISS